MYRDPLAGPIEISFTRLPLSYVLPFALCLQGGLVIELGHSVVLKSYDNATCSHTRLGMLTVSPV